MCKVKEDGLEMCEVFDYLLDLDKSYYTHFPKKYNFTHAYTSFSDNTKLMLVPP